MQEAFGPTFRLVALMNQQPDFCLSADFVQASGLGS